jgi:hypothetical protein
VKISVRKASNSDATHNFFFSKTRKRGAKRNAPDSQATSGKSLQMTLETWCAKFPSPQKDSNTWSSKASSSRHRPSKARGSTTARSRRPGLGL